jgi:hypothetical protein
MPLWPSGWLGRPDRRGRIRVDEPRAVKQLTGFKSGFKIMLLERQTTRGSASDIFMLWKDFCRLAQPTTAPSFDQGTTVAASGKAGQPTARNKSGGQPSSPGLGEPPDSFGSGTTPAGGINTGGERPDLRRKLAKAIKAAGKLAARYRRCLDIGLHFFF